MTPLHYFGIALMTSLLILILSQRLVVFTLRGKVWGIAAILFFLLWGLFLLARIVENYGLIAAYNCLSTMTAGLLVGLLIGDDA
jgi:hypothetical protein